MTCDSGNPGSGMGQAQRCGRVKPVHVYGTLFLFSVYITGEHMTIRQAQHNDVEGLNQYMYMVQYF